MRFSSSCSNFKQWNESTTALLMKTTWGRRLRLGLLAGTVVAYPICSLIMNGPLVKHSFSWRRKLDENGVPRHVKEITETVKHSFSWRRKLDENGVPRHVKEITETEYVNFLAKNNRSRKDAVVNHRMSALPDAPDTVSAGSLGVRTGLELALPFNTRFRSETESLEYMKKHHPNGIEYFGKFVTIDWGSETGSELASCFFLSPKALRFLAIRDLYAHDGWQALANRPLTWATFSSFAGVFTYWLHTNARIFGSTALSFACIYVVSVSAAWYASKVWHDLYRYITDVFADSIASHTSFEHCDGGKEYYWKMLKRNRILRDLEPGLSGVIKFTGDVAGITTPLLVRFDHLKDVNAEDDEVKDALSGDD